MIQRFAACAVMFLTCAITSAAEPMPTVTVLEPTGESTPLTNAQFTQGTRRLAWLADPKGTTEDAKKGPLAFELREPGSSTFVQGVLTLIPLSSIEGMKYDYEKKLFTLQAAGIVAPFTGSLEFIGFNAIGLEAEVKKGTAGIAVVKYRGGQAKGGIRGISMTGAKPYERKPDANAMHWSVQILDAKAKNPVINVTNLRPLYRLPDGTEKFLPVLPFQKTLQLDWADVRGFKHEPPAMKGQPAEVIVVGKDGKEQTLSPKTILEQDGKKATLLGLLGEVPGGFKLIPLHTILELKPQPQAEK